jgi:DNA-binding NtrC family response regulator
MKKGAKDFLTKPWDNKELLSSIKTALQLSAPPKTSPNKEAMNFEGIIGQDPAFLEVLEKAKRISKTDASVLILGESGTGKELLAEAIHYESLRASNSFVKVNLGGISSTLFESEMFGHKKGAFTDASSDRIGRFELADNGTIFLDEIGDLNLGSQVKLLRVLQEKTFEVLGNSSSTKVDVRVISATNKSLQEMVAEKSFREDLFYRINLITLTLPPLRERKSDIPLLVNHYIKNLSEIYNLENIQVSKKAMKWLIDQVFTGNIRQLKNLVERSLLLSPGPILEVEDFQSNQNPEPSPIKSESPIPGVGEMSLEEMEKEMILKALDYHNYKVNKAALSLGITRSALYRRMSKFNIAYEA